MMGSAQLDHPGLEEAAMAPVPQQDLKQQVAERLAAHRERRLRAAGTVEAAPAPTRSRKNPIAAAVAERFAHTPSYRAFLAEQAQHALDEAAREAEERAARAEVAARNLQAIAHAQQKLLDELAQWNAPQTFTPEVAKVIENKSAIMDSSVHPVGKPATALRRGTADSAPTPLTVRLYEDFTASKLMPPPVTLSAEERGRLDPEEASVLDDEIAFRQSPVFESFVIEPTVPLPANLLEFPRQLVAPKKARPRLAEGPLLDEDGPRMPQLRIFEVEQENVPILGPTTPVWANIHLDAHVAAEHVATPDAPSMTPAILPPDSAPISQRLTAATVDCGLVATAFLGFIAVAAHIAGDAPIGLPALVASLGTLALLYPLYQLTFFMFSDQTPGMRYARLGFCTFADENPTRSAIRRRMLAQFAAVCPFGLGLLWALLDEERLGWHDRLSRMYLRAY